MNMNDPGETHDRFILSGNPDTGKRGLVFYDDSGRSPKKKNIMPTGEEPVDEAEPEGEKQPVEHKGLEPFLTKHGVALPTDVNGVCITRVVGYVKRGSVASTDLWNHVTPEMEEI